jgi:DNA gyrase subunit B
MGAMTESQKTPRADGPGAKPAAPAGPKADEPQVLAKQEVAPASDYDEADFQVLEGIDHVRKRPSMYIGDTTPRGLHHLVFEIVDNSIDEAMAGYCHSILVRINKDGSATIIDDGRGIPVGMHPTENKPTVEVAFAELHSGTKFEHNANSVYKVSGGLHGVGASVVNALSEWLEVEVSRGGEIHQMEFERGRKSSDLKVIGKSNKSGTKVTFKPDIQIFPDIEFRYEVLQKRLRELAYLNEGLQIVIQDDRSTKHEEFKYEKGLIEYVRYMNDAKTTLTDIIYFKKEDPATRLVAEVALQYNDGYNETIESFANNINTHEGGTHISGFKTALTGSINRYAESANLMKKDSRPSGEDVREGLIAVVSVKVPEPQFEGQTKTRLGNSEVEGFVSTAVNEALGRRFEEFPKEARAIVEKGMLAAEAREAARKARELTRRKSSLEGNSLPGKLSDCRSRSNEDTEIFLVEGDSAGGSAKQGRDSNIQAILALRGKLLNVEKANLVKMLGHEEIRTIISALGCGIREDFDLAKRRYGRVVIMTDADVDGSHIRTLLLTFFFRHMQDLIKAGRVYVAQPPLYLVKRRKAVEYVLNERAMRQIYIDLGLDGTQLIIRDDQGLPQRTLAGEELLRVVDLLGRIEEIVHVIQRRGIDFAEFLARRDATGRVPAYRVVIDGQDAYFFTADERDAFLVEKKLAIAALDGAPDAAANGAAQHLEKSHELHEVKDLERYMANLGQFGLTMEDYFLTQEESVSGEKLATKYALVNDGKTTNVAGVAQIVPSIQKIGKQGIEVSRFKGLGEMDAEQLWETTMDPARRTLLRINLQEAGEAERLFSVLMGEDVERRRQFIEDHALDVKNLDV